MNRETGMMLIEVCRNLKGCITVFERWVRHKANIGTLSLSPRGGGGATTGESVTASGNDSATQT